MSALLAKPEHEVVYQDLCELIRKHADELTSIEILAVAANMVGKLVALQDQRNVSPKMAMEIVTANLELGNRQVIDGLATAKGGLA
jgi:hypothetical protein